MNDGYMNSDGYWYPSGAAPADYEALLKVAEAAKGEAARHNDAAILRGQDHCYCDMCAALAERKGE